MKSWLLVGTGMNNLLFASYDYDLKTIAELETFFTEKAGKEVKIWIIK
jgi:hypothetical protein